MIQNHPDNARECPGLQVPMLSSSGINRATSYCGVKGINEIYKDFEENIPFQCYYSRPQ